MLLEAIFLIAGIVAGFIVIFYYVLFHKSESQEPPLLVKTALGVLPGLALIILVRSFCFEGFRIPSASMQPTLLAGDFVLVDKFSYGLRIPFFGTKLTSGKPKRGDIVVFRGEIDGETTGFIKRIVGLPGDHIEYRDRVLFINGKPAIQTNIRNYQQVNTDGQITKTVRATELLDSIAHDIQFSWDEDAAQHLFSNLIVPQDSYFVIGDFRDNSNDSRDLGVVPDAKLIGKARAIVFSIDWPNKHPRWYRITHLS